MTNSFGNFAKSGDDIFDEVLDLENQFYNEGYEEGVKDGKQAGLSEGRQFGIQTAYQRFLSVGLLKGRITVWKKRSDLSDRTLKNISALDSLLENIPMENDDKSVEEYEKRWKKAKSRALAVKASIKDGADLNLYEHKIGTKAAEMTIEEGS